MKPRIAAVDFHHQGRGSMQDIFGPDTDLATLPKFIPQRPPEWREPDHIHHQEVYSTNCRSVTIILATQDGSERRVSVHADGEIIEEREPSHVAR